jgi:hypothetical protein
LMRNGRLRAAVCVGGSALRVVGVAGLLAGGVGCAEDGLEGLFGRRIEEIVPVQPGQGFGMLSAGRGFHARPHAAKALKKFHVIAPESVYAA